MGLVGLLRLAGPLGVVGEVVEVAVEVVVVLGVVVVVGHREATGAATRSANEKASARNTRGWEF